MHKPSGFMGYPTKVQLIDRKASQQWYVNFPSAVAQAMEFSKGETVEWLIEDKNELVLRRTQPVAGRQKKTASLLEAFDRIWDQTDRAFKTPALGERARSLALGSLLCLSRHTITGMIVGSGRARKDWSADYRLFERGRIDQAEIFHTVRRGVVEAMGEPSRPIVAVLDDTLPHKSGRKIPGVAWRRDPLGPKFQTNLAWARRFQQFSLMLPEDPGPAGRARAIPIRFDHCPTPKKPKPKAAPEEWTAYRAEAARTRLPVRAVENLALLRKNLDEDGQADRRLIAAVDGGYTNKTVLNGLPERTTFIGRIRKDAKLYALPEPLPKGSRGRPRQYGDQLPTPERMRQDESIPWTKVTAWAAGKTHEFDVKIIEPVLWSSGGPAKLRLMIIRPLAYRLSAGSDRLYRDAAYLICNDPNLSLQEFLQNYLWRWEIEVNHREEKNVLGVGQPQVRAPKAVEAAPAFQVSAYACLLLASHLTFGQPAVNPLPRPKRQPARPASRLSINKTLGVLRAEAWGKGIRNFSGFAPDIHLHHEAQKNTSGLAQAVCLGSI